MNDPFTDIPKVLPIVPIRNKVLLPGGALRLQIVSRNTVQLIQKIYRSAENKESKYIIGCVPIQPPSYNKSESKETNNSSTVPFTLTRNVNRNSTPKKTIEETFNQATQPSDLHEIGCAAKIVKLERTVNGFTVVVEGVVRIRVNRYVLEKPYLEAEVAVLPDPFVPKDDRELQELVISLKSTGRELLVILQNLKLPTPVLAQLQKVIENVSAGALVDLLISTIESTYEERLQILDAHDLKSRMSIAIGLLAKQINMFKVSQKIHSTVSKKHREFYLRQQLNAIKEELGERDDSSNEDDDVTDLTKRIKEAGLSPEADKAAQRELKRLKRMHSTQAEYQVVRTYLEWLSEIPWSKSTTDIYDINKSRQQLEDDHYSLESVKKRVLEYLAVLKLKEDLKGPILCLLGPPGVGKTSLGKSIASALGRKFHRISLGGIRDEAEIRGHRRTYIGAMPGLIAQGLRRVGVNNPVFLLDEIDKVGHLSNHGDPSAALLEVLDPEQNNTFNDHYLNVPLDLSKILFIATANHVDTIPAPLLDRMELITVPGYTFDEKVNIAQRHLLPKQITNHGLSLGDIKLSDEVLLKIASGYTREAGVRNLEREIASVCRAKAVEYANAKDKGELDSYNGEITMEEIENILGVTKFDNEVAERIAKPGVVTGLAWTASGSGGILFIEATQMAGKGNLQLTGRLGEVIKESAKIALSWVREHAFHLGITTSKTESTFFFERDVHIHFPAGAVGKDGPSAGIALTTALVSLFTHRIVPPTTAMTGEITLRGQVLPVGGIKEKIISAHRAGIKKVILPTRNRKDVEGDVPVNVKNEINFVYANNIFDVLQGSFEGEKIWTGSAPVVEFESRL
ncbi:Lon protease C-terminal proteolytic domain-containing protein [Glomus cerebriforme]|uniref:Lon protease homolog 2, peroxisomal n=1 Tax=Glomus cerebriforme TaxID=658196 RepID=A0A397SH24_9GLOM|nr:Lon protease C-terminal proteolytic domain-containing protein [Glomus cerebriforme]